MSTTLDVGYVGLALRRVESASYPGGPDPIEGLLKVLKAVGLQIKSAGRSCGARIVAVLRFIKKKMDEGAEMHNRVVALQDERFARNWYVIRGGML